MSNYIDKEIGELVEIVLNQLSGNEEIPCETDIDTLRIKLSTIKTWVASNISHSDLKNILGDEGADQHLTVNQLNLLQRFTVDETGNLLFDNNRIMPEVPIRLKNKSTDLSQSFLANTWVERLTVFTVSGSPIIRIGVVDYSDTEILDTIEVQDILPILVQRYFQTGKTFYISISGGVVDIRIDVLTKYN